LIEQPLGFGHRRLGLGRTQTRQRLRERSRAVAQIDPHPGWRYLGDLTRRCFRLDWPVELERQLGFEEQTMRQALHVASRARIRRKIAQQAQGLVELSFHPGQVGAAGEAFKAILGVKRQTRARGGTTLRPGANQ
jgi:hypothetical protein